MLLLRALFAEMLLASSGGWVGFESIGFYRLTADFALTVGTPGDALQRLFNVVESFLERNGLGLPFFEIFQPVSRLIAKIDFPGFGRRRFPIFRIFGILASDPREFFLKQNFFRLEPRLQ